MLLSALIFGLLGSFHCIGMCGPIAFLLPLDRDRKWRKFLQIFLYHTGRLFSYSIIGLSFGIAGRGFSLFGLQQQLSIIVGSIMIILVLLPKKKLGRFNPENLNFKIVRDLKNYLGKELKKKNPDTYFTVGFLNGFLPCGLVYMAVFGAVSGGSAIYGSLYMIIFGLGTIPLMTSAIWLGNTISVKNRSYIRKLIPICIAMMAVLFILRGLGLGISYLSPVEPVRQVGAVMECSP